MWKLLLLAVLANTFFLSLGTYESGSEEDNDNRPKKRYYKEDDDSEENEDEIFFKIGYKRNKYICDKKYSSKCSSNCTESFPPYDCDAKGGGKCANAVEKLNKGILRAGIQMLKVYVDSSPSTPGAISPLATLLLLSMLAIFGEGETAAEVYAFLNLSNKQEIQCAFDEINYFLRNLPCGIVSAGAFDFIGNCQYQFTDEFNNVILNVVSGEAVNVNFAKSELAACIINGQVELETGDRVKNVIVDSSIFNRTTELIRIAGTYFSSPWETEFEISKTVTEFCIAPGKQVPGRFYTQCSIYDYAYSSELKAKAVEIPYQDNLFRLLVILPDTPFKEDKVIDRMLKDPTGWYERLRKKLKPMKVDVTISEYVQENWVDDRSLLFKGTNLRTIYSAETIQLKGAIEGDIPAGVSLAFQKHRIEIPSTGCPVKKLPKGDPVKFVANISHIWFLCFRNTVLYIGYTNGPTDGKCR